MEQVDQQRAAAQEARENDQAMLTGLRERLEAARTKAFTATRQRNLANNRAALVEVERDRTCIMSAMQDHAKRDLHQQLTHAQHVVMDLHHEVHYLNNQLHSILDEEDEDIEILVEDDGWDEEEVEPENEDDPISDLDSDLNEDQNRLVTS